MRVCFVGDVVGSAGRRAFKTVMPSFLKSNNVDCCIVNAENSVHGLGASINMLRDLEASGKRRIGFIAILRLSHDDRVDQAAGNDGVSGPGRGVDQTVDLHDDFPAVRLYCLADRERIPGHEHVVKRDVSLPVGCGSLDQCHSQLRQFVVQEFFPVDFDIFDLLIVR